ncbi:ABC transporter substrate-binding protein [Streptomyces sp. ISL-12]|uniref:ABC transporter substrate-binding protein n=1 Tax=Streptomyces sp. ISL-12 TaxID=2819177 RepID=UPI0027E20B5D|nr:ABC transporter substrate-binding protein [Streptomyces sp. ISL-12]
MRVWKWKAALGVSTVVIGLSTGCSSGSGSGTAAGADGDRSLVAGASEGPSAAPSTLADGMGSDQETDGVFPRTVDHFQGSTTIEAEPEKIAVLSTGQLDDLLSLGVVPTASTRADNAGLVPDYLTDTFPQYKSGLAAMTDAGTRQAPNLESLAAAGPDLILVNDSLGDLYPKLSKIAPTVVTAGQGVNWKRDLLLVGDAIGKGRAARQLLDDIVEDAQTKGAAVAGDPTVSMGVSPRTAPACSVSPPSPAPSPSTWDWPGRSRSGSPRSRRTSAPRRSTPPTPTGSSTRSRATPRRRTPPLSWPDRCGSR